LLLIVVFESPYITILQLPLKLWRYAAIQIYVIIIIIIIIITIILVVVVVVVIVGNVQTTAYHGFYIVEVVLQAEAM